MLAAVGGNRICFGSKFCPPFSLFFSWQLLMLTLWIENQYAQPRLKQASPRTSLSASGREWGGHPLRGFILAAADGMSYWGKGWVVWRLCCIFFFLFSFSTFRFWFWGDLVLTFVGEESNLNVDHILVGIWSFSFWSGNLRIFCFSFFWI